MIKDLTRGTPLKLIVQFAFPILIGNIFQQFFQISDILIVGRLLGVEALAAVGASAPIFFMFLMIAFGFTAGLTIITAQKFGARNVTGIKSSVFHSTLAALILGTLVAILLVFFLKPILKLMNVPSEILDQSYIFMLILGIAIIPIVFYNLLSGFIRALGDSKTPLYFLIFSSILNIVLNFVFIYYFKWGVAGSACGTFASVVVSAIACIWFIKKRIPLLQLTFNDCKYNHQFMMEHLRVAVPMALQFSILALSMMIVQSVCNSFGTEVIAGFTAAMRIEQISTQPLFAFGIAFATYVAQNYGAALIKRIRQGVRQCLVACLFLSIAISLAVRFFGTNWVSIFIDGKEPRIISIGQQYLMISSYFYFFLSCIFIVRNALQGMGKTKFPLISGFIELIMRSVAVIYLSHKIGYTGVFWAGPIAWFGGAIVVLIGYWWVIKRLKPRDMKEIFLKKQQIQVQESAIN